MRKTYVRVNLSSLTVANKSVVSDSSDGAGIYNSGGTVTVSDSTFSGNSASGTYYGGGIDNYGTLSVSNSTFASNGAFGCGGICNYSLGTVSVNNSTFASNRADYSGGSICNNGTLTVNNSTFSGNSARGGGGIYNSGTLTVNNSTFSGNSADDGGGIYNSDGTVTVSNSTFSGNSASSGGGIGNGHGTLSVSNSTFSGNSASTSGGGIDNDYSGTVTVNNSTFSGNSASQYGGGIHNYYSRVTVTNSTFSGNSADYGGGIWNDSGTVTLGNTIVANSPTGSNCAGAITDGSGNLSYPDTTCPGIKGNPVLGPLQDNGGLTHTMALGPGSGARDAANDAICAAPPVNNLDQRGITRPQGPHCDIGAFETFQPTVYVYLPIVIR